MRLLLSRPCFMNCFGLVALIALFGVASAGQEKSVPKVHALLHFARTIPGSPLEKPARMSAEEFSDYLDEQMALMKSNLVVSSALRLPEAAKLPAVKEQQDPQAWLLKRLQIDVIKRTGIVRLTVQGGPPEEQAVLANAVAKAYLHEVATKEARTRLANLDQLKKYYADYDTKLRDKRETLRHMQRRLGNGPLSQMNRQFAVQQVQGVEKDILEIQSQLRKAKIEIPQLKAGEQEKSPSPQVLAAQQRIERLHKVEKMLNEERETRLREFRAYKEEEVDVTWLRDEIRALEEVTRQLAQRIGQLELELQAPARVSLLQEAEAPGK